MHRETRETPSTPARTERRHGVPGPLRARRARAAVAGAAAGLLSSFPMALVMAALHRRWVPVRRETPPPREVTSNLLAALGIARALPEEAHVAATAAGHYAYGAAAGALYGALSPAPDRHPVAGGTLYGTAVWAVSYLGWLPVSGLFGPPAAQPPNREAVMVVAHLVWGAATGLLAAAVLRTLDARGARAAVTGEGGGRSRRTRCRV